jgi:FtsH-binding integral membrane protein
MRGIAIHVPPPPHRGALLMRALLFKIAPAVPFVVMWFFIRSPQHGHRDHLESIFESRPLAMGAAVILFGWCTVILGGTLSSTLITVDPEKGIRIGFTRVAVGAVHDLRIVGSGRESSLILRSSRKIIHIAKGQTTEDLAYVRDSILRAVGR